MKANRRNFEEGVSAAEENGHTLANDHPSHFMTSMSRMTCTKCGCAVLGNGGNAYGSAIETRCPKSEGGAK